MSLYGSQLQPIYSAQLALPCWYDALRGEYVLPDGQRRPATGSHLFDLTSRFRCTMTAADGQRHHVPGLPDPAMYTALPGDDLAAVHRAQPSAPVRGTEDADMLASKFAGLSAGSVARICPPDTYCDVQEGFLKPIQPATNPDPVEPKLLQLPTAEPRRLIVPSESPEALDPGD